MIRFYLLTSAILLFFIALGYGVAPGLILPQVLDIKIEHGDLTHIFRAVMGLYLAMAAFWGAGAFRVGLMRPAVLSEIVFMAGLALGRLLSVVADGWPSPLLTGGMALEFALAAWGILLLKTLPVEGKAGAPSTP